MTKRVQFCGVIEGSVTVRPGETEMEAIARAQAQILAQLDKNAKRLQLNIGLEHTETGEGV